MTETLATTVIAVSVLLVLVLMTRRAVARQFGARVAYALWLLPAARLLMPSISVPRGWFPSFSSTPIATMPPSPIIWQVNGPVSDPAPIVPATDQMDTVLPILAVIWIIGMIAGAIWVLRSQYLQAQHIRQTTLAAPDALSGNINRAMRLSGLKRAPIVRMSPQQDGPLVTGLFQPTIVLPENFTARFTPTQQRLALLHEMTHVRRGDLWAATAMIAFRLVNWPNPLIHWAWSRFRADQEAACDASVLRRIGDTARADYAETLLTAARSSTETTGRANPITGPVSAAGLTLSLHHPIKERLMTLGLTADKRRGATRWALAALLLTGTAISAPLSLADDQVPPPPPAADAPTPPKVVTNSKMRWIVSDDESTNGKGFEIREDNGVRTYLRVSRDGTTETLTREELAAEYGEDFDKIPHPPTPPRPIRLHDEPGLQALGDHSTHRTFVLDRTDAASDGSLEITVENGKRQVFRVSPDGTRTELEFDDLDTVAEFEFNRHEGGHGIRERVFVNSDNASTWITEGKNGVRSFAFGTGGGHGMASTEARLRSAQSMIEAADKTLGDMREEVDGVKNKDLRNAERELEKARKALEKAMDSVRKSEAR